MPPIRPAALALMLINLSFSAGAQQAGWRADSQTVERAARNRPQFNYDESRVPPYDLPDPLTTARGSKVRGPARWRARRREILEAFREHVYGRSYGRADETEFRKLEEDPRAMGGAATLRRVAVISNWRGRTQQFGLTVFLPNAGRKQVPLFLLLNNRPPANADPTRLQKSEFWPAEEVIARGYGVAELQVAELAPDDANRFREGVINFFEGETTAARDGDAWGALAAWAWGASRAMDYFETDPRVDARKVAVVGHSRGGKAALWAGAQDERFALTISNESGEGGAALSRRQFGETVAQINRAFPHWFADNYKKFGDQVSTLPIDQHMLLALIAPRALYVASADEDLWADPRGEFLSLVHSSPVYALWGEPAIRGEDMPPLERPLIAGRRGYHVRRGVHNLTSYDWKCFVDFADTLWRRPN